MRHFITEFTHDARGAVAVETILMFILMLVFISASIRVMKLHANNQQAYIESQRKAIIYATGPFDFSQLARAIDDSAPRPDIPSWKQYSQTMQSSDLAKFVSAVSHDGTLRARDREKIVTGFERRSWSIFNADAFGMRLETPSVFLDQRSHMLRSTWTFSGFPGNPGQDPFFETVAIRSEIGEIIDKELLGFKINRTPLRTYLKMKPIWYKPITFQDAKPGSY